MSLFSSGKAAFYMMNAEIATTAEGPVAGSFEYGMFPCPAPPTVGGDGTIRQVGFILPYFVRNDTKYPDLCADFLNWMLTAPCQEWGMTFGGWLPSTPMASWLTDKYALQAANIGTLIEYAPSLSATIDPALVTPVVNGLGSILTGATTAAQVTQSIETAAEAASTAGQ